MVSDIDSVYLVFAILSAALFWWLPVRRAILLVVFGGWLVLPVGHYPPGAADATFPWWVTGLALPGAMLMSKAWVVPVTALCGAALLDFRRFRRGRPHWIDLPMVLWCLWPFVGGLWSAQMARPAGGVATLYLAGSWGALWLLGRIWFSTTDNRMALLKACAWSGAACLPFALVEGIGGYGVYGLVYEMHPFHADGWTRYVGFRPIGFFEHGNQYGLWVSLAAVAAVWVACVDRRARHVGVALGCVGIALAAQSIGAILLALLGMSVLVIWQLRIVWPLLIACTCVAALGIALHLSRIVPLEWIARETEFGRFLLDSFRALGRGSFLWRFSQDLKVMDIADSALVTGTMVWDWWRPAGVRPWGLWMLLLGQYGLIGLALVYGGLLATSGAVLQRLKGQGAWQRQAAALPLALIVGLALADTFLNAFLYFPALLAAGAIARRTPVAAEPDHRPET